MSELATSFNSMTAKIRQMIGEVKKKEKLDAELEIAIKHGVGEIHLESLAEIDRVAALGAFGRVPLDPDQNSRTMSCADRSGRSLIAASTSCADLPP